MFRWLFFATLSIILLLQLRGLDGPLREAAPGGIVGYELAWSASGANEYLSAWRGDLLEAAKVSLGVDFAFLLAYPFLFATSIGLLTRHPLTGRFDQFGSQLKRAVLLCIPLDATENLALWRMIDHGASDALAHLATICAVLKFALVIAAALWCLIAISRRFGPRTSAA